MVLKIQLVFLGICFLKLCNAQNEAFQLPNTTKPESYYLFMTTTVPDENRQFTGLLSLTILVLQQTHDIYLHSRSHSVIEFHLYTALNTELESVNFTRLSDDVIKFSSQQELQPDTSYRLEISFVGNLLLTSDGFFRSDFVVSENGNDIYTRQAATHFRPSSARHAFPCYDTPLDEHRATFLVFIENHNATYTAISSMPQLARIPKNELADTIFRDTPRLSPSSLAFFISGFNETTRETASEFSHLVSVRALATDYTEKLFNMTDSILTAFESLISVEWPADFALHTVALPHFDFAVSSFYGLNYYREDLILFDPLVSPSTKLFAIAKRLTNGIVSQFLGNIVLLESWNDAWLFKGLTKFLEYHVSTADIMFIIEVLHPTLRKQSFPSTFPFTHDEALGEALAEKAACTFRMIYYAIGGEAFAQTLHRLIDENSFRSISTDVFYRILHEATSVDLGAAIEGFVRQETNMIVTVHRFANGVVRVVKKPLAVPFNYITSSMPEPSAIEWLASDTIEEIITISSLADTDWLLANVDQFGFYRVNYDDGNWRAIIAALGEDPQVFSSLKRAQLLDDSLSFARDGFLPFTIVSDLLLCLHNDTSFAPWNAAMSNLLQLDNLLSQSDIQDEFRTFVLELSDGYVQHVGFDDDRSDEDAMSKLARSRLINFACRMGSSECLSRMHSELKSHIDDNKTLPVNLESSVFCSGLMASSKSGEGPRLFEALRREMLASGNTEYRSRIVASLGCYGDVNVLFDLLETTLATSFEAVQSVYSGSVEGVEATMDFMIEFPNDAVRLLRTANLIEILVEDLSMRIFNERLLMKFKAMMDVLEVPLAKSTPAIELVERNVAWVASEAAADVIRFFRRDSGSTSTTPTTSDSTAATTTVSTTESLAANRIITSAVLGAACVVIRLVL